MLKEIIQDYFFHNSEKKAIDKKVKELSKQIKSHYDIGDSENFNDIGLKVELRKREKTTIDQDELLVRIKELGESNPEVLKAIKVIEVVDEAKVIDLIGNGIIEPQVLQDCTETKVTGSLYVTKIKGEK